MVHEPPGVESWGLIYKYAPTQESIFGLYRLSLLIVSLGALHNSRGNYWENIFPTLEDSGAPANMERSCQTGLLAMGKLRASMRGFVE